jgi:hypothetical protein
MIRPSVLAVRVGDGDLVRREEFAPGLLLDREMLGLPFPFGNGFIGIEPGYGELASVLSGKALDSAEPGNCLNELEHSLEGSLVSGRLDVITQVNTEENYFHAHPSPGEDTGTRCWP